MQISLELWKCIAFLCNLGILICEHDNANDLPNNNWSSQLPLSHSAEIVTETPAAVFDAETVNATIDERASSEASLNDAIAEVTTAGLVSGDLTSAAEAKAEEEAPLPTSTEAAPTTAATASVVLKNLSNENMPSFSEWTQKRLEEKARKLQNSSDMKPNSSNANNVVRKTKLKSLNWKNYASPTCGAKVLDANSDTGNPNHIITASKDEYCLNKCKNAIWFIIELCEAIQIKVFEMANFELYSSSPHEFELAISDRYQPKEWTILGNFSARNDHEMQQFRTDSHLFSKYVRLVVRSHHGNEHYCTISHVRLFGISEIEALKKQDDGDDDDDEDDDSNEDDGDATSTVYVSSPNDLRTAAVRSNNSILSSAKRVVNSVVEKFKEFLGPNTRPEPPRANSLEPATFRTRLCQTPKYRIEIATDDPAYHPVLEQVSCNYHRYQNQREREAGLFDRLLSASCSPSLSSLLDVFVADAVTMQTACYWNRVHKNEAAVNESANKQFDVLVASDAIDPNAAQNKDQTNSGGEAAGDSAGSSVAGDSYATTNDHLVAQQDAVEVAAGATAEPNSGQSPDSVPNEAKGEDVTVAGDVFTSAADTLPSHVQFSRAIDVFDVYRVRAQRNREPVSVCTRNAPAAVQSAAPSPTTSSAASSTGPTTSAGNNTTNGRSSTQPQQQESVFLRLSNRIKILEQNLSLSSQYLEELSQRYKKQVEDMRRHFDVTLGSLRDKLSECDRSDESIRNRLFGLARQMSAINERTAVGWPQTVAFYAKLIACEVIVTVICLCLFSRHWNRQNRLAAAANTTIEVIQDKGPIINYSRRKSVDAIPKTGTTTLSLVSDAKTHQRRSSHEPQLISTTATTQSGVDQIDSRQFPPGSQTLSKAAEKRRRRKLLKRNHSDQQQQQQQQVSQQKHDQRLEERHEFEIDADTLKVFVDEPPTSCSSSASLPSSNTNENATESAATAFATEPVPLVKTAPLFERDSNRAMSKTSSFKVKTTAFAAAAAAHVTSHKRNKKKGANGGQKNGASSAGKAHANAPSTTSTTTGLMKFIRKVF